MPDNKNIALISEQFEKERHLDLNSDIQLFFDTLVAGKTIIDVGAGLGRSKERMTRNIVTTWDPSPHVASLVDFNGTHPPDARYQFAVAFEVIEHIRDDCAFLGILDRLATEGVFISTPNWYINMCRSSHHFREYTHTEFETLLRGQWPTENIRWFANYRGDTGCLEMPLDRWLTHSAAKHCALIEKIT